jgi:type VI secretion system protein ImpG
MNDSLLQFYSDQLHGLRREAKAFAERYALASELAIDENGESRDPSVERLLQGTAFLAARVEKRLADDFPELTESLLSVTNPMQVQPYPSVTIVQFQFPVDRPSGEEPVHIPAGTAVECVQSPSDVKPRFVTRWPLHLPRVRVREAQLGPALRVGSLRPRASSDAINELRLVIEPLSMQASADELVLFLHSPGSSTAFSMFELLGDSVDHVAISAPDGTTRYLEADTVEMFGPDWDTPLVPPPIGGEALRPYSLMADLAALPEKFLYVQLKPRDGATPLLPQIPPGTGKREWTIVIYLKREALSLHSRVQASLFQLGCVPAINLFPMTAEFPHRWTSVDQPVEPDRQRRSAYEVHSVLDVTASRIGAPDDRVRFEPLYHPRQSEASELMDQDAAASAPGDANLPVVGYWSATRRASEGRHDCALGTDVFLRVVDPEQFRAWEGGRGGAQRGDGQWAIAADVLVTNRNLVRDLVLTSSGRSIELTAVEGGKHQLSIRTLVAPTEPGRRHLAELMGIDSGDRVRPAWRAIAMMSASRMWMTRAGRDDQATRRALTRSFRDLLRLHSFREDPQRVQMSSRRIQGITDVEFLSTFGRVSSVEGDRLCQGLKVRVSLNEDEFSDGSMFLFAAALERMLGFLAPINSFVQLESYCRQRGGSFGRWRKRAGEMLLS